MSIEIVDVTTKPDDSTLGSIGNIELPNCDKCVSCNVCKFKESYENLKSSISTLLTADFSKETPPGKIIIRCNEYKSNTPSIKKRILVNTRSEICKEDLINSHQSSDDEGISLTEYNELSTVSLDESPSTSIKTVENKSDDELKREKNIKALDSLDYLVNQLESSEDNTTEDESSKQVESKESASISMAEKNYVPITLFGRKISYHEAVDLVNRGVLLNIGTDPNHPIFRPVIK